MFKSKLVKLIRRELSKISMPSKNIPKKFAKLFFLIEFDSSKDWKINIYELNFNKFSLLIEETTKTEKFLIMSPNQYVINFNKVNIVIYCLLLLIYNS